jgi:hypothetical protein
MSRNSQNSFNNVTLNTEIKNNSIYYGHTSIVNNSNGNNFAVASELSNKVYTQKRLSNDYGEIVKPPQQIFKTFADD